MGVKLGFQCKMYYGSAGAPATTELKNVGDAEFSVIDIGRSEPLKEAVKAKIKVEPTYSTRAPVWQ